MQRWGRWIATTHNERVASWAMTQPGVKCLRTVGRGELVEGVVGVGADLRPLEGVVDEAVLRRAKEVMGVEVAEAGEKLEVQVAKLRELREREESALASLKVRIEAASSAAEAVEGRGRAHLEKLEGMYTRMLSDNSTAWEVVGGTLAEARLRTPLLSKAKRGEERRRGG